MPAEDGGAQVNNYIVQKREAESDVWTEVAGTVVRSVLKVKNLSPGVEYKFRIFAENRFGRSEPLVSSQMKAQWSFKESSSPSPPEAVAVSRNWVDLKWNEPVNNGGDKIFAYYLQKKERTALIWQEAIRGAIKGTSARVGNLSDGVIYEFRVQAENRAGKSKPSQVSEGIHTKDACDRCGQPEVIELGRNFALIKWAKPEYDGGAKITGYIIEREEESNKNRWMKCNFSNVLETEYKVTGLNEGDEYRFRVIAKNAANTFSEPSEASEPCTPKDEVVIPEILVDAKYQDTVTVKAGDELKFMVHTVGTPHPEIRWKRDGRDLVETKNVRTSTEPRESWVLVKEASRHETGVIPLKPRTLVVSRLLKSKSVSCPSQVQLMLSNAPLLTRPP